MIVTTRKTAGELANAAAKDNTKYDAWDLALESTKEIEKSLYEAVANYKDKIEEKEFCVVYVVGSDPLIKNMIRRKFYCWPWLPSPRPNQAVFLYNKEADKIVKRLWVLPNALTMAELAESNLIVHPRYQTMRDWSVAFYKGTFWEFIRYQHGINMLSQQEHFELHRDELLKAKENFPDLFTPKPFDFSKVGVSDVADSKNVVAN